MTVSAHFTNSTFLAAQSFMDSSVRLENSLDSSLGAGYG